MTSLCPVILSEKTGNYVQSKPKFIPRDHPHYDVMIPEEAREKTNLYCGHPDCEPNPCQNGGTCTETMDDFTCECHGSFVGKRCEMECDAVYPGSVSSAGSCYLFSAQDHQTWQLARDRCDQLGGYLVAIETPGELITIQEDILLSFYGVPLTDKVWTGLSDTSSEGDYEWTGTGETLTISSSLWGPGQPNPDTAQETLRDVDYFLHYHPDSQSNTISKMKVFKQLLIRLVICIPAFQQDVVCPGDASSPDSCYLYRQDQQTWEVARDTCDELGGYLVAMGTQSEQSSIRNDVLASHYGITTFSGIWVGLNDRLSEQVYTWEHVGGTLPHSSGVWGGGPPLRSTGVNQDCCCAETTESGEHVCQNGPLALENACPEIFSEKTGGFVRSTPKFIPRDHPQYDVMVPEAARGKTNLYCAHPECVPNPCLNGGTCSETLEEFTCKCQTPYVGKRCEVEAVSPGSLSSSDSCYFFSTQDPKPWEKARDSCDELGGYLLALETPSELSTIQNEVFISHYGVQNSAKVWTGLNDLYSEGVYEWTRAGGTLPLSSSMWKAGQPNPNTADIQDCVVLRDYELRDTSCSSELSYICEFSPSA
ncbi:macrophage mannose receptor 1-like [Diadema antillarum]|uniref:macrophage mannose receptor 1-like n=1 Tax=Diadema antillarum TaxID=105358 RepID=UPI003A8AEF71